MPMTRESDDCEEAVSERQERDQEPKPWTAPDFVEHITCAEIGAYALRQL